MKKIFILILALLTLNISFAQKEKQYIEHNKKYLKTRIFLKNSQIIIAKDLRLINDSVILFKRMSSQGEEQKSIKEISFITAKKGTKAIEGALIGAGIGLFSSVYSVAVNDYSDFNSVLFITGFTLGSAVIGTLIGICIPTWKRLYPPDNNQLNK